MFIRKAGKNSTKMSPFCQESDVDKVKDVNQPGVDVMFQLHCLIERHMHDHVILYQPDHDALLVIQQGIDCRNSHFGGGDPVFCRGRTSPLDVSQDGDPDIQ